MDDFEKELKLGFLDEAEQSIADVEQSFLSLETDPDNKENINNIFRLAHNLKGSSKAVGFDQLGQFTHEFETFVLKVKNEELKVSASVVSLLLKTTDFIKAAIVELRSNLDAPISYDEILHEMKNFSDSAVAAAQPTEPEIVEPEAVAHEVASSEAASSEAAAPEVAAAEASESVSNVKELPKKAKQPSPAKAPALDESIRVASSKVERLLNAVGEMVILQSVLAQTKDGVQSQNFKKTMHQLSKVSKEIQDISMGLRMVPIKPVFQKMQRIVRDTAQLLNKEVNLILVGEESELDKNVLENINDPLVHLIRNSVDHGIEAPEKRVANGKSAAGNVELKAYHRSGRLVIDVIDDGGGLSPEFLRKKAIEKGILSETEVLSDAECYKLIFRPGFSTKEQITEVSGRGVGMDVVKTNIEKLGGEIQVESTLGKGTVFRIALPLTLAIVDAMIVSYGGQKFVLPLNHICETLRPQMNQVHREKNLGLVLMLRGENLPMYHLGDFFAQKRQKNETNMIAMVFRNDNKPYAILVDDIIAQQPVVVKRLSDDMEGMVGISGTTILGDGKPCLILEAQDLLLRKITQIDGNNLINETNILNKKEVA